MDKYRVIEITNKKVWESFVLSRDPKSFLQSWNWGETNKLLGKKVVRLGFYEIRKLVCVCQIIEEKAKRGPHFIIPGGPLLDWQDKKLRKFVVTTIKKLAKKEDVWFIRLRPEVIDDQNSRKLFQEMGFISAPMHLHAENTWVLEIARSDDELLANMRKTTRYLIRKSLNLGLKIVRSQDPKSARTLKKLQDETVARHKFMGFPEELFKAQLETFGRDDQAVNYLCKKGKQNLASAIIIYYGDMAYYHHSASTSKCRDIPFSYYLQWKIIQDAKEMSLKYYNFWGVAPNDNPKHRFAGVTIFKTGFGGHRADWLHARDLPVSKFYWFTYIFETLRRIVRRLD